MFDIISDPGLSTVSRLILKFLDSKSLYVASQVSKTWNYTILIVYSIAYSVGINLSRPFCEQNGLDNLSGPFCCSQNGLDNLSGPFCYPQNGPTSYPQVAIL